MGRPILAFFMVLTFSILTVFGVRRLRRALTELRADRNMSKGWNLTTTPQGRRACASGTNGHWQEMTRVLAWKQRG